MPPVDDSSTAYWALRLNHRAVTLSTHAPWDTVQLTATPVSASEEPLDASGAITRFVSLDSSTVRVTPQGFVTARASTTETRIIVTLTLGRFTYSDTLRVKVVNNLSPKRLDSLSIQPPLGDSAKFSIEWVSGGLLLSDPYYLKTYASDGSAMDEILMDWRILDPLQGMVFERNSGYLLLTPIRNSDVQIGTVRIVASAYAYGVARVDTLFLRVGHQLYPAVRFASRPQSNGSGVVTYVAPDLLTRRLQERWNPNDPILGGVGAEVTIWNYTSEDVDLVFDDTAHIDAFGEQVNSRIKHPDPDDPFVNNSVVRKFTAPGDYRFRDTRTNASGIIRVVDERLEAVAQRRWFLAPARP